jgi:hypothetical protein
LLPGVWRKNTHPQAARKALLLHRLRDKFLKQIGIIISFRASRADFSMGVHADHL